MRKIIDKLSFNTHTPVLGKRQCRTFNSKISVHLRVLYYAKIYSVKICTCTYIFFHAFLKEILFFGLFYLQYVLFTHSCKFMGGAI